MGVAFIFVNNKKLAASEATPYFFYLKKNKGRGLLRKEQPFI